MSGVVQATAGEGVWSILRVVSTRSTPVLTHGAPTEVTVAVRRVE